MTDFEAIKQMYIRKNIEAYITDISPIINFNSPIIKDLQNEITYWFLKDGSLNFITNDRETQS